MRLVKRKRRNRGKKVGKREKEKAGIYAMERRFEGGQLLCDWKPRRHQPSNSPELTSLLLCQTDKGLTPDCQYNIIECSRPR